MTKRKHGISNDEANILSRASKESLIFRYSTLDARRSTIFYFSIAIIFSISFDAAMASFSRFMSGDEIALLKYL